MSARLTRGFTLLELMIVLVLLGIVATIALPNLLEGEAQAEAAALQADVSVVRKAWTQLLALEGVQLSDPELADTDAPGLMSVSNQAIQESAPKALLPFLSTLTTVPWTRDVLDLDPSGKPQIVFDATGRPTSVLTRQATLTPLEGPRHIRISTKTIHSGKFLLQSALNLPDYTVLIHLDARTSQAADLLRLSRPHFEEQGYTVQYVQGRTGSGYMFLYFVP